MNRSKPLPLSDWVRAGFGVLIPRRFTVGVLVVLVVAAAGVISASLYWATQHTVVLEINGTRIRHRTHQRSTEGILREVNLVLQDQDQVVAHDENDLLTGIPLQIILARQVLIIHDGSVTQVRTHTSNVDGALQDAGVFIFPSDRILLGSRACAPNTPLPSANTVGRPTAATLARAIRQPVRLVVRRAVPLRVQDGNIPLNLQTSAQTVGEALYEQGIVVYQGDRVFPDLGTEITPGLYAFIERSKPVTLDVGGTAKMLRTRLATVRELLQAEEIALAPKDYVLPDPRTAIARDLLIAVVRVLDEYSVQETRIPYETRWEPEASMEIDQRQVKRWGVEGAKRQRVRVHYENGREIYHTEEEEWIAREPTAKIFNYGTKIVLRAVDTPSGPATYWRKLRMLATSYSAATSGTSPSRPWYGLTRLGLRTQKGIVAVDPQVINLGQGIYVPGYGQAIAADTGNAIVGRRLDLCFDDNNLELWYRWVDVYVLSPVPDTARIGWLVPDTPQEWG